MRDSQEVEAGHETRLTGSLSRLTRRQTLPVFAGLLGAGVVGARAESKPSRVLEDGARVYNVRAYGAKGDGKTLDTGAVQRAIDACNADGGGTVLVPAGRFLIGSVQIKSNVTLRIVAAGTLLGSARGEDYHAVEAIPLYGDSTLEDGNWALLYAVDAKNVTVEGPGAIDGQGAQFHSPERGEMSPSGLHSNQRPYHLLFYRCENLRVRDIDLIASAYHSVRVIDSHRVHMDGIYIFNRVNGNNDGFHFVSCRYVMVSNCTVLSQDDACALFGSCQFVTVTNSSFSTRWSVFRFGGGVARDIAISNCVLHQVFGCPIKFQGPRGSRFENITFSNLVLDEVTGPISISMGPAAPGNRRGGTPSAAVPQEHAEPPVVRNLSFSNITGTVVTTAQQLPGWPYPIPYTPAQLHSCIVLNCAGAEATMEKISFENIHLTFGGGGTAEEAARRNLPEIEGEYFQLGPMPAYGLYARNAHAVTLNNVRFEVATPDLRPAIVFDGVEDAAIDGITVQGNPDAESAMRFTNSREVLMTAPRLLGKAGVFLRLEGEGSERIVIDGGDIAGAAKPLEFADGAASSAVRRRE